MQHFKIFHNSLHVNLREKQRYPIPVIEMPERNLKKKGQNDQEVEVALVWGFISVELIRGWGD